MRKLLILLAAASSVAAAAAIASTADSSGATTAAAKAARPQIGDFGFDVTGMDRSVAPGASFYRFANGHWDERTEIPADRSNFGMFGVLEDLSRERSHTILEEAARTPGSRMGDLYASFMDEAAAESAGITPLRPMLDEIKGIGDRREWAAELGRLAHYRIAGPFRSFVNSDERDPNATIMHLMQGGLGLPDRDYYLNDDAALAEKRTAYQAYLARLLTLAGETNADARAAAVMQFEHGIAGTHWTRIQNRDEQATYNKWAAGDFARQAPGFDWAAFFEAAGVGNEQSFLVAQPSAFTGTARLIGETPQAVLNDYLLLRALDKAAPYLSRDFVDANFAFQGTVLNGTPQNEERWKRGVTLVTSLIPDDLSQVYVQRYFPPEAKAAADQLVRNVIAAMDRRLASLEWMSPETREKARHKLTLFTPKIGYPEFWHDYSSIRISRDNLVQNILNATRWDYEFDLGRLGHPMDRREWGMTPMTINAYANPVWNEIVFPAAILQPPFFDPNADPAINYGGIGAVIGHELSHHFDDQGSQYDETGALREWWTPEDRRRFNALTAQLVAQYDQYEPMPGHHVQGGLTLGENIADLAGMTVAYDAYRLSLNGREAPTLDGLTGDQRFYLGWAQVWRRKYREANLLQRLLTDPHSPSEQRVAVVRNLDPWYRAYSPSPSDALYLAPERRVKIW